MSDRWQWPEGRIHSFPNPYMKYNTNTRIWIKKKSVRIGVYETYFFRPKTNDNNYSL